MAKERSCAVPQFQFDECCRRLKDEVDQPEVLERNHRNQVEWQTGRSTTSARPRNTGDCRLAGKQAPRWPTGDQLDAAPGSVLYQLQASSQAYFLVRQSSPCPDKGGVRLSGLASDRQTESRGIGWVVCEAVCRPSSEQEPSKMRVQPKDQTEGRGAVCDGRSADGTPRPGD